jgi:hypothetical protein
MMSEMAKALTREVGKQWTDGWLDRCTAGKKNAGQVGGE